MKITIFASLYPPPFIGGAEGVLKDLTSYLLQNDFELHVVSIQAGKKDVKEKFLTEYRILNIYNPFTGKHQNPINRVLFHLIELIPIADFIRCIKILRKQKSQLVICHNLSGWSFAPWLAAKVLGIPIVQYLNDYGLKCVRTSESRNGVTCNKKCFSCKPRKFTTRRILSRAILLYNSNFVKQSYELDGFFLGKKYLAMVLHPPVFIERSSLVGTSSQSRIGYVGRITIEKGVIDLLEATKDMNCFIKIYGVGAPNFIQFLEAKYPHAVFLGYGTFDEIVEELDVIVVPSRWNEPFGKTALEFALAGKTLVVASSGGLVEAIKLSNANYFVFNPGDVSDLAEKIKIALLSVNSETPTLLLTRLSIYEMLRDKELNDFKQLITNYISLQVQD